MHRYASSVREADTGPGKAMASLGECLATPFPVFPRSLTKALSTELCWFPELGYGYFPATGGTRFMTRPTSKNIGAYAQTEMGARLNVARIALVARHYQVISLNRHRLRGFRERQTVYLGLRR